LLGSVEGLAGGVLTAPIVPICLKVTISTQIMQCPTINERVTHMDQKVRPDTLCNARRDTQQTKCCVAMLIVASIRQGRPNIAVMNRECTVQTCIHAKANW